MSTIRIQSGLLLQTLVIVAGCKLGIMFLLPVVLPGATGWVEAVADAAASPRDRRNEGYPCET